MLVWPGESLYPALDVARLAALTSKGATMLAAGAGDVAHEQGMMILLWHKETPPPPSFIPHIPMDTCSLALPISWTLPPSLLSSAFQHLSCCLRYCGTPPSLPLTSSHLISLGCSLSLPPPPPLPAPSLSPVSPFSSLPGFYPLTFLRCSLTNPPPPLSPFRLQPRGRSGPRTTGRPREPADLPEAPVQLLQQGPPEVLADATGRSLCPAELPPPVAASRSLPSVAQDPDASDAPLSIPVCTQCRQQPSSTPGQDASHPQSLRCSSHMQQWS